MTSQPTLPPDLEAALADYPDLAPGDLASPWRLAEGANPLEATPAPSAARIQAIQAVLTQTSTSSTIRTQRPALRLVRPTWMAAAAVVVLLVAVGLYLWQQPITVHAPYGDIASVDLPDGSQVQLNSGSSLTYDHSFDSEVRRVHLDGEAFFDVARAGTPFIIETFNAQVQVLGTSFNVRAWDNTPEAETIVSVETGIVEVFAKEAPEEALRLVAGEAARVEDDSPMPSLYTAADPTAPLAWREGRFVYINEPLGTMFDEIERRFGIEVVASETIRAHALTIKTQVTTADQLIGELCQSATTLDLRYRAMANGFEVFED